MMSPDWERINLIVLTPVFAIAFGAWAVAVYSQVRFFFSPDRKKGWSLYLPGFRYQLDMMRGDFAPYGGPIARRHLSHMRNAGMVFLIVWLVAVVWSTTMFFVLVQ